MKFLIDAQLPRRLVAQIRQAGLEAIHTLDLPAGNRTTDRVINELSIKDQYIVVTKDSDFVESLLLRREPWKLLLISTGNISNRAWKHCSRPRFQEWSKPFIRLTSSKWN